jgi:hypothetical protein
LAGIFIVGAAGTFCDLGMRNRLQDFFAAHHDPASERTLKQSVERINYCVDLKAQQGSQLAAWLQQHSLRGIAFDAGLAAKRTNFPPGWTESQEVRKQ